MAGEIRHRVLPLAVGVVGGCANDPRSALPGALSVGVDVGHPHHHVLGAPLWRRLGTLVDAPLHHHQGTRAEAELGPVVADPQAFREPEGSAEPFHRLAHVRVFEFRNDGACRHGAVHREFRLHGRAFRW